MFASMTIILVGVLLVLVIAVSIFLKFQGKEEPAQGAYVSRGTLMTLAEQEFYRVLRSSLPVEHYQIFSKVRMADIVDVQKGMEKKPQNSSFNKIKSKHVDFLLCNPSDSTIYAVVELDDSATIISIRSSFASESLSSDCEALLMSRGMSKATDSRRRPTRFPLRSLIPSKNGIWSRSTTRTGSEGMEESAVLVCMTVTWESRFTCPVALECRRMRIGAGAAASTR